jgi:hypothetical protein
MDGLWYMMDLGNIDEKTKKPVGVEQIAYGLPKLKDRLRDDIKAMAVIRNKIAMFRKMEIEAVNKVVL